ncbi:hypothetical protein ACFRMQ_24760 [Kitasatospora sp. NPDC056783]|uniref:hypothetical protein n=1 Tax=Kitasatospora sp. NPDC056783 TaxID=3345943 RepID=UPI00369F059B
MTRTEPHADADPGLAHWLTERRDGPAAHTALSGATTLPTAADVLGTIDCGLLAHPYLEVYRGGARLPAAEVFTARRVQNHKVTGFVHHRNVTGQYRAGATLRLPSVSDWLAPARPALATVREALGRHVEATAYLAAAGHPVAYAEAAADAVVLVCSGSVTWHTGEADSAPLEAPARTAVYVPAGTTRGALAGDDGDCLLLVLAERPPATAEIVRALRRTGLAHLERQEEHRSHHLMPVDRKADWVLGQLAGYFAALDPVELLRLTADRP